MGVNVSPYRVVRVVDKEGHITGIRESSDTTLECTRQVNLNKIKICVISQIIFNANEDIHSVLFYKKQCTAKNFSNFEEKGKKLVGVENLRNN